MSYDYAEMATRKNCPQAVQPLLRGELTTDLGRSSYPAIEIVPSQGFKRPLFRRRRKSPEASSMRRQSPPSRGERVKNWTFRHHVAGALRNHSDKNTFDALKIGNFCAHLG